MGAILQLHENRFPVAPKFEFPEWCLDADLPGKSRIYSVTGYVVPEGITIEGNLISFFMVSDGETEEQYVIDVPSDENFAIRGGHLVTLVWMVRKNAKRGPFMIYYNHNTRALVLHRENIQEFSGTLDGLNRFMSAFGDNAGSMGGLAALFMLPIFIGIILLCIVFAIPKAIKQGKRLKLLTKHFEHLSQDVLDWAEKVRAQP